MFARQISPDQPTTSFINPDDFSTTIDNPFMPMKPGTTFVYEDKADHVIDYVVVTNNTKVLEGVTCVEVHDFELQNGQLSEDTRDWMAQDTDGNVWYFGENSHQYEPNNPDPVGHEGSWKAGVHGAAPGIIMEANPQVGDVYNEENAPGIAQDMAAVRSLHESRDVVYGSFNHLLETRNFSPLEPDVTEHKWYALGVGNVLTTDNDGAFEQLVQIKVDGDGGNNTLDGYAGRDAISGNGGNDTMSGLEGADVMFGGTGNDTMAGNGGHDLLRGDAGNDALDGGAGNDTLNGGTGDDTLTGGNGADHFAFDETEGSAVDTITDYSRAGGDAIVLDGGEAGVAYDRHTNHHWEIVLNDGHTIVFQHLHDTNHNGHILDQLSILDAWGA